MFNVHLRFESGEASLSVRRISVREGLSSPFELTISAVSSEANLEMRKLVGYRATCILDAGGGGQRVFRGVCRAMRQDKAEPTGLSSYSFRIVPKLWWLTQRRNHRVFREHTLPTVARCLLREWDVPARWHIDEESYRKREYRTQYGETDDAHFRRTLEEAGMSFFFADGDEHDEHDDNIVVLTDAPHAKDAPSFGALPYIADVSTAPAHHAYVTRLSLRHEVRPDRVMVRDHDFRGRADIPVGAIGLPNAGMHELESKIEKIVQESMRAHPEIYSFEPGALVDDKGDVKPSNQEVAKEGAVRFEAARSGDRSLRFDTNAIGLSPGTIFTILDHPKDELGPEARLLVTQLHITWHHEGACSVRGRAAFADRPHRPRRKTPRPRVAGVQSAVVVGPRGEDVHTDRYGRVRVQFPWDREGCFDGDSSCWVRVSHGWAGAGFGMMAIPRVGQEVLVSFIDGDLDHPVIVGRVYGGNNTPPCDLPAQKAVSIWRGCSTPGGRGASEFHIDDTAGREAVHLHSCGTLTKIVDADESESTEGSSSIRVGADRVTTIGSSDRVSVGDEYALRVAGEGGKAGSTGIEMRDGRIILTTGKARLTLDDDGISLEAQGAIRIHSKDDDVLIQGGPNIRLNSGLASSKTDLELALTDMFGNPIERSWLRAEVHVDGEETRVHEGFTGAIAHRAVGKKAVVHISAPAPFDSAEDEDVTR